MFLIKLNYFDGHYTDSGLSSEEREKIAEEALEKDAELEEWPEL